MNAELFTVLRFILNEIYKSNRNVKIQYIKNII